MKVNCSDCGKELDVPPQFEESVREASIILCYTCQNRDSDRKRRRYMRALKKRHQGEAQPHKGAKAT